MVTAEQIRTVRAGLKESQQAFGQRFGVDQSTIHRWETDGPPTQGPGRIAIERILIEIAGDEC